MDHKQYRIIHKRDEHLCQVAHCREEWAIEVCGVKLCDPHWSANCDGRLRL